MNQISQKESINDNEQTRAKFLRRARLMYGADSIACKPSSPQSDETDDGPNRVESHCGIGFQCERINHKKNSRNDIHALIQDRITLCLFQRDKRVRKQK